MRIDLISRNSVKDVKETVQVQWLESGFDVSHWLEVVTRNTVADVVVTRTRHPLKVQLPLEMGNQLSHQGHHVADRLVAAKSFLQRKKATGIIYERYHQLHLRVTKEHKCNELRHQFQEEDKGLP